MRNKFDTTGVVFHYVGYILIVLGILLLVPLVLVLVYEEYIGGFHTGLAFITASAVSLAAGISLKTFFSEGKAYPLRAMLICGMGWVACSAVGAIPYVMGIGAGYLDAYFETMSGFTTTGITMFTGLDYMPRSILFWRSMTQWLGGLGILSFFLIVAFKGTGAHVLFGAESHKIEAGRPVPGFHNTVRILWYIYAGFSAFIFICLWLAGMPWFDSMCHTMTTLPTGGYSPHDASIGFYRDQGYPHFRLIEYITILGMLMGGMNFLVHYRVLTGKVKTLFKNTEMKLFWSIIAAATAAILIERYYRILPNTYSPVTGEFWALLEENFRSVLFQVVSILTTTGFGTEDIGSAFFGSVARQLFLALMFIGGCVGSTGGGIKVQRIVILAKLFGREVFKIKSPEGAINTVMIDGSPVHIHEIQRAAALFFFWIALIAGGGAVTAFLSDYGGLASISGMFSAVSNIGPCYIPFTELSDLHWLIKIVYIFGMLAGRLEILPAVMLLNFRAWKY